MIIIGQVPNIFSVQTLLTDGAVLGRGEDVARPLQVGHGLAQHAARGRPAPITAQLAQRSLTNHSSPEEGPLPPALGRAPAGDGGLGHGLELGAAAVAELGAQPQQRELPPRRLGTLQPIRGEDGGHVTGSPPITAHLQPEE